jgi:D-glycero-alpha-D-manno-heptose-7-phosphate kinase
VIISRTPFRMSFVGGGSDLPAFYREHGGAVLSAAIDKYVYVTVNKKFDDAIRVAYSKTEEVDSVSLIEHRLVRAALTHAGLTGGVEITTVADIPARGTGLGSSSSFTVALLQALAAFAGRHSSSATLAADACHIEIDVCGEPIGKQDQYAAAYGGFNLIEFLPDGAVKVSPVICSSKTYEALQQHILLLYTGITRSASALLRSQSEAVSQDRAKSVTLRRMVELTHQLRDEIQRDDLDAFGEILHENWELKKTLTSGISTDDIDGWYATARQHGARGGKVLGAGAGGFLMLYAPPETHLRICHALPMLRPIPVRFERFGSQVIFYHPVETRP